MPVNIGGYTPMQAAGANTQAQYNDNGVLGGNPGFVFNEGTTTLTANNFVATSTANLGAVGNVTITGGTNNYVLTTNGSGNLSWTAQTGGISGIAIQEEGTNVVATANIVNFVGAGATASNVGGVATITIPGGISGVLVKDEGTNVVANATTVNFVGAGVVASNVGGVATVTVAGGISGVAVQEEGTNVVATANTINFVGSGVTASNVGGVATITVAGGIGGVTVQDEGSNVLATANTINFVGSGVTASNVGNVATVSINGISGITVLEDANLVVVTDTIGFTGPLVSVANVPGNIAEATFGLTIKDEGNTLTAAAAFGGLNFVGAGVTASADGNIANITIPGTNVVIQDEGTNVLTTANTINFTGAGVVASNVGGVATVTITGSAIDTIYNKGNVQGTTSFSYTDGTIQTCTAIGNVYLDFTSLTTGQSMTALITQDSVGNRIATYPGPNSIYFAANVSQLSTAPGAVDMINVVKIGSKLYATLTQSYTAA